jgi:hypothetical protein
MRWCAIGVCLLVLPILGCGGKRYHPVSGRVMRNGQPLAGAIVVFQPVADNPNGGAGSTARTDADGRFTLAVVDPPTAGALEGKHTVRILLWDDKVSGKGVEASRKQLLLPKYNDQSTLTFEVLPGGSTEANFDVSDN